ncbi:MAG: hypothetical protein PCFJNLEI_00993 [Verrucomicrobiae bacterium]|nr:hypothetical protein [Verrucomicrobiae bacterium]
MKIHYARVGLIVLLIGLVTGCATPYTTKSKGLTSFLAYEGNQSKWPTSSSALTEVDFAIPAYLGLPAKPYRVLGFVVSAEPLANDERFPVWLWSDETRLANACNLAKEHGADAVLLTKDPAILGVFRPEAGRDLPSYRLLTNFDGVILAIKWMERR